jgi:DNA repair protein RadD
MAFTLRHYQQDAVDATVAHFRQSDDSAVIVLPTGAGKSLVIAELARIARRKILVLAHVKELVEQNHNKYESYGLKASIYSAGLNQKDNARQVTFASIQSVARNLADFSQDYSLVIIDECHRVSGILDDDCLHQDNPADDTAQKANNESQYLSLIKQLKSVNPQLKVLGLTATPYRMGVGWIYQYHYHGYCRTDTARPFKICIYDLPLKLMIKQGYLTPPKMVDAAIAHYDFSSLIPNASGNYNEQEVNSLLQKYPRVTKGITEQIKSLVQGDTPRQGVMIFAATVKHATEVASYLDADDTALITADTPSTERQRLIQRFKNKDIHFLVNVSVLTTGFDAPHVDVIAILRPTQSVSLFQQIVGRGLRLSPNKTDCLVIDYAGNGFDLFYPEVGETRPSADSVPVMVPCPQCGFANTFWGKVDDQGHITEHFGRKCRGLEITEAGDKIPCDYRFRFKECPHCGAENDIAARQCASCQHAVVDPDDQLKAALRLKNAMVIRCSGVVFEREDTRVKISYVDEDGLALKESFNLAHAGQRAVFNRLFGRRFQHAVKPVQFSSAQEVVTLSEGFSAPDFVIARKVGKHWRVKERLFDYVGAYRKANEL